MKTDILLWIEAWLRVVMLLALPVIAVVIYAAFFKACRQKMREEAATDDRKPWEMKPEAVRLGFDLVREAIPVDDEELSQAKRAEGNEVRP